VLDRIHVLGTTARVVGSYRITVGDGRSTEALVAAGQYGLGCGIGSLGRSVSESVTSAPGAFRVRVRQITVTVMGSTHGAHAPEGARVADAHHPAGLHAPHKISF